MSSRGGYEGVAQRHSHSAGHRVAGVDVAQLRGDVAEVVRRRRQVEVDDLQRREGGSGIVGEVEAYHAALHELPAGVGGWRGSGVGGDDDVGRAQGVLEHARMQRGALDGDASTRWASRRRYTLLSKSFYRGTKAYGSLRGGYGGHVGARYHHLAGHHAGDAAGSMPLLLTASAEATLRLDHCRTAGYPLRMSAKGRRPASSVSISRPRAMMWRLSRRPSTWMSSMSS